MEFTYNGLVRYSYGFYNPNHAAAMIVMLLPLFWGARTFLKNKWAKLFILLPEILLYVALVLTYSRTGIVALAATALLFFIVYKRYCIHADSAFSFKKASIFISFFAMIFLAASCASGALPRFYKWVYAPDKSVTNRFPLWQGACDIFADNPFGVGTGLSGKIYTEFYQAPGKTHSYRTMVNSFLTFISEQGVIWSILLASIVIFTLWTAFNILKNTDASLLIKLLIAALLASLCGGFVSGMGSTCFDLPIARDLLSGADLSANAFMQTSLLLLTIAFFAILLCLTFIKKSYNLKRVVVSCIAGIALCSLFMIMGCFHEKQRKVIHSRDGSKWIELQGQNQALGLVLLPDKETCERKTLLEFFQNKRPDDKIIMPLNSNCNANTLDTDFDSIVLCGSNINCKLENLSQNVILFLPGKMPSKEHLPGKIDKIYLSEYDETGSNASWEKLFASHNIIEYI